MKEYDPHKIGSRLEEGCYSHGLFMEGGGWHIESSVLREANPKELYFRMPIIHFQPVIDNQEQSK